MGLDDGLQWFARQLGSFGHYGFRDSLAVRLSNRGSLFVIRGSRFAIRPSPLVLCPFRRGVCAHCSAHPVDLASDRRRIPAPAMGRVAATDYSLLMRSVERAAREANLLGPEWVLCGSVPIFRGGWRFRVALNVPMPVGYTERGLARSSNSWGRQSDNIQGRLGWRDFLAGNVGSD